jgi:hypothetical protein
MSKIPRRTPGFNEEILVLLLAMILAALARTLAG